MSFKPTNPQLDIFQLPCSAALFSSNSAFEDPAPASFAPQSPPVSSHSSHSTTTFGTVSSPASASSSSSSLQSPPAPAKLDNDPSGIAHLPAFLPVRGGARNQSKWCSRAPRLADTMARAKRIAEIKHASESAVAKKRSRPSRATTARKKSSKRSAEICRMKMNEYISLIEAALDDEAARAQKLQTSLLLQSHMNATAMASIADLEQRIHEQQQQQQLVQQQFNVTSPQSEEPVQTQQFENDSFMSYAAVQTKHTKDSDVDSFFSDISSFTDSPVTPVKSLPAPSLDVQAAPHLTVPQSDPTSQMPNEWPAYEHVVPLLTTPLSYPLEQQLALPF